MKIRTITCHDVANYGAALQALALQTYLKKEGHDVRIIDYVPEYIKPYDIWKVNPASHLYKPSKYFFAFKLFWALRKYVHIRPTMKRLEAFKEFNGKYLELTRRYSSYEELANDPPIADVYIAGSDQIWRTNLMNGKDPAFYLQFGNKTVRRMSYAASFGLPHLTDGMDYLVRTYLSGMDAISVRESSGLEILEKLGVHGKLVIDPVFLLTKTEWINLLGLREALVTKPYLLVYDLNRRNMPDEKQAFAQRYAKKNGLKIIAVNDIRETDYADININNAGPAEFVNLIANAQYVLSDSFHATAFSCIMHTPFRVYFDLEQAIRIKDFLKMVEMNYCMNCPIEKDYEFTWNKTQDILSGIINDSKNFLDINIEKAVL
ncbi:polysaccharide pyruvyl transferase family protein [Paraprevotella clara]|uniref:polysaccharide pyruvyl transferase family protein n=1 Tax=Paraprevotella clara TaxID=454154 RepID=UPI002675F655|nr:polysaccharide pyruvyl transferase family protein [Paraprevotella clara]